jgi:hypothetical protein
LNLGRAQHGCAAEASGERSPPLRLAPATVKKTAALSTELRGQKPVISRSFQPEDELKVLCTFGLASVSEEIRSHDRQAEGLSSSSVTRSGFNARARSLVGNGADDLAERRLDVKTLRAIIDLASSRCPSVRPFPPTPDRPLRRARAAGSGVVQPSSQHLAAPPRGHRFQGSRPASPAITPCPRSSSRREFGRAGGKANRA